MSDKIRVLFVCTGNICRSPTAQGIFELLVATARVQHRFDIDSAGISNYHSCEAPDPRTQKAAQSRGVDLSKQRARQIELRDFYEFDWIIAMDTGHFDELSDQCPDDARATIKRLLDFCHDISHKDVPDPYYGNLAGFERVFDICDAGCRALLQQLHDDKTQKSQR